ncbi:hypothetical protein [Clostridium celatum]|uniref:Lipoprotein n=1 Tax=Clostridium celatum DSM 1785 TaxID=545697 RepID=L1QCU6_9CLOT|nr:hypothetical protein [Clostridium celatum]EKY25422.1 hypothetical protein HMPREF0216_02522 [Clostridium celatum DSM 1785]MCE9655206.1 hypothetical protein [Clostridium celatum]MDU6296264.1 hypothetical protein [Clostridium celatum]MDY3362341.1 hypothetical protein [Clostridium celatum]
MKKLIIAILIVFNIFIIGCTDDTIVLESDARIEQSLNKYEITEKVIEDKEEYTIFEPVFFNEDKVYGTLSPTKLNVGYESDEIDMPYLINLNGEVEKLDENYFTRAEKSNLIDVDRSYGIYSEGLHLRDRTYYYADIKNNIKIKLDNYETLIYELEDSKKDYYYIGFKVNEDYYVNLLNINNTGDTRGFGEEEKITIIDIKNNKVYNTYVIKANYRYFYYDIKENNIMAIDETGKVSKVEIIDDKIVFEYYKTIDLKGLRFDIWYLNNYTKGDNIILNLYDDNTFHEQVIYNIYSNEVIKLDKFIVNNIDNSDYIISSYNGDIYLSEINDELKIDLIYKIAKAEEYDNFDGVINDKGNTIFLRKVLYNDTTVDESPISYIKKVEYSFIEIER